MSLVLSTVHGPYITAVNFFSNIRHKRLCLVHRLASCTGTRKLSSLVMAFQIRPHGIVRSSCRPRLLSSFTRGYSLLSGTNISCYYTLSFAPRVTTLSTHHFVIRVLGRGLSMGTLVVNCSRHFKRRHDRNFSSCIICNESLKVSIVRTRSCSMNRRCIDSSVIETYLARNRIKVTTHYLTHPCALAKRIIKNFQIKRSLNFPATGLQPSSSSGLLPGSNICTI